MCSICSQGCFPGTVSSERLSRSLAPILAKLDHLTELARLPSTAAVAASPLEPRAAAAARSVPVYSWGGEIRKLPEGATLPEGKSSALVCWQHWIAGNERFALFGWPCCACTSKFAQFGISTISHRSTYRLQCRENEEAFLRFPFGGENDRSCSEACQRVGT